MEGFESPNYTQTPNDLFDHLMRSMGDAELRVTLAVVRGTLGYHRTGFKLSLRDMAKMTGLSTNGTLAGAEAAEKRGIIRRVIDGQRSTYWELVISVSLAEAVKLQTVSASDTELSHPVRHSRKTVSLAEELIGLKKESLNKEKERLSQGQSFFLDSLGAKRFKNGTQAEAVLKMESSYGLETLKEGVKWAATQGMSLGRAISSLQTALPNWGKPKNGNGKGNHSSLKTPSSGPAWTLEERAAAEGRSIDSYPDMDL